LLSRDRGDGRATGHPQGVGPEAYLNGTSQGPTSEDAWKDVHIRGRSKSFMEYPGYITHFFLCELYTKVVIAIVVQNWYGLLVDPDKRS
jgi:hypothetical protein